MKKIRNTQLMLRILPFVLTIMLLMSCDSQNTNKSGYKDYQGNLYVDTIVMSDAEQNQVRITLGWNEEIGEITVEEDSAQLPKRIEQKMMS